MGNFVKAINKSDVPGKEGRVVQVAGRLPFSTSAANFALSITSAPIRADRWGRGTSRERWLPVRGTAGNSM